MDRTDHPPAFRPDLQGLRALAVLLVVLGHADVPFLRGGFVGVDVFFVISGFLITRLLLNEYHAAGRIDFLRFYARRLRRLLPALLVMVCSVALLLYAAFPTVEARRGLESAIAAVTWTSNLLFARAATDYFGPDAGTNAFLHTWSLGVEEQFYLVWPALLVFLLRLPLSRRLIASNSLLPGLILVLIAGFAASVFWTHEDSVAGFFYMPSRIWQFALGGIIAAAPIVIGDRTRRVLGLCGIVVILASAFAFTRHLVYPGVWALLPSAGAATVLLAGQSNGPLAHPALVWIGDRSYSLYLWHWPLLVVAAAAGVRQPAETAVLIGVTVLIAAASYRAIELPFWKGVLSRTGTLASVGSSVSAIAVAAAAFLVGAAHASDRVDVTAKWRRDMPRFYAADCDSWYYDDAMKPCVIQKAGPKTVVLIGDSMAAQWASLLPRVFDGWSALVITKSSCAMVDVEYRLDRIGKTFHVCTAWRGKVLDEIERRRPEVVILGNSTNYTFSDSQWVDGSRRVLQRLSGAAKGVVVIPGTPRLGINGPTCVAINERVFGRAVSMGCQVPRDTRPTEIARLLTSAAEGLPNVHVVDLADLICATDRCGGIANDGTPVFRDEQHLTDTYVASIAAAAGKRMHAALGQ